MRDHINTVRRLLEFDDRGWEGGSGPKLYRLIVLRVRDGNTVYHSSTVDNLDDLSVEELVIQLRNYQPVKVQRNIWFSAPLKDGSEFAMRVTENGREGGPPSREEITQIDQLLRGSHGARL